MSLVIRAFGTMEIEVNGQPAERTRTRTELWLLAWLLLHHEREADRNWLASLFWPDSPEQGALYNLRRSLNNLRAVLGPEAKRILSPTPRTLRLDAAGADIDVVNFDAAIKRGEGAALLTAIELYRGPLLEGCRNEWILPEREIRQQAYLDALETLAREAEAQTRYGEAARYLYQLLTLDPVRESAVCALMQTLAAQGDTAAITQVYRNFCLYLHQELNASPAEQTVALYRQLSKPALIPATSPPTPTAPSLPRRLPVPLTPLIGREEEIEAVCSYMQKNRLVTLTGTGGVGKTRLAIAVAENVLYRYAGGVWFVDLAPLADETLVPRAIASTLGVREQPDRSVEETLAAFLHARSVLLLLDNCEHLIEAAARCAAALLAHCPELRVVATSRQPLQIPGEQVHRVPSLPFPTDADLTQDEKNLPSLLMDYASVRLFMASAASARAAFRLTSQNAPAVAALCQDLDGIPLALELAAARVGSLSIDEVRARLSERFRLLRAGNRAALPRHQSLQAVMDWSYDLLNAKEKTLLNRLSVFSGGWTLDAAEAVCADCRAANSTLDNKQKAPFILEQEDILDLLLALVDKSLVAYEESEGVSHYRLLETVCIYGRARLLSGDVESELLRTCLRWQDWEKEGYFAEGRALLEVLLEVHKMESNIELLLKIKSFKALGVLSWRQGVFLPAKKYLEYSLALCSGLEDKHEEANILTNLGNLAREMGDYETSRLYFLQSLMIDEIHKNLNGMAKTLNAIGWTEIEAKNYDEAWRYIYSSLFLRDELGDREGKAFCLTNLAWVECEEGNYPTSLEHYEQAFALFKESRNKLGEAESLHNLGRVALKQGKLSEALTLFQDGLRQFKALDTKREISYALVEIAGLFVEDDPEEAARLFGAAQALKVKLGIAASDLNPDGDNSDIIRLRENLGEHILEEEWKKGYNLSVEDAITVALKAKNNPADQNESVD